MPKTYSAYVICGTPRSGSTLICEMLAATGVAGRPNSYFRQQDIVYWADQWSVPHPDGTENAAFDQTYLDAMQREGSNGTGVFGLRIMWASLADASRRLDRAGGGTASIETRLEQAFGPIAFIHLSRDDKAAQAVSLLRAEQSGLWHLASDGSVLEGSAAPQPVRYDEQRLTAVFKDLENDDTAWNAFFAERRIEPLRLTYETVTANPRLALADILRLVGQDPAIDDGIAVKTAKMGDATSREWANRLTTAIGR